MADPESGKKNSGDGTLVKYTCGHYKLLSLQYGISIDRCSVKVKGNKDPDTKVESGFVIEFDCIANVDGSYGIDLYFYKTTLGDEKCDTTQTKTNLIDPIEDVVITKGVHKKLTREVKRTFPDFSNAEIFYLTIQTRSVNSENGTAGSQFTQAAIQKQNDPGYPVRAVNQKIWFNGRQHQLNDYTGYDKTAFAKIPPSDCEICFTEKMDCTRQRVGNLMVSTSINIIGKSRDVNASILDGFHGETPVTVKKMLKKYKNVADKEIEILQGCVRKPNFPILISKQEDEDEKGYVYIAVERCACSLKDMIRPPTDSTLDVKDINLLFFGPHH